MRILRLLQSVLVLCSVSLTAAAETPFLDAKPDALYSSVLKQKRQIDVYLPSESVKAPGDRYETLYVLDGDWNAHLVVDIVSFMRQVGVVPPLIIVSVPNFFDEHGINSRDHDLTPTVLSQEPRSGGAGDFLTFLRTELVPYVDGRFPTNHVHLIHGHSYGGLFLIYALLHEPGLFDGYAVLDPALGWDNHALDAALAEQLPRTPTKGKTIYIAGRAGRAFAQMGIASAKSIFEEKAPRDLHWNITEYPSESHDSLKLKATYDALRYAYGGYTGNAIRLVPNRGILVKGKAMFVTVDGVGFDEVDLRYTSDGSTPTDASPRIEAPFAVLEPEKTTVKLLSNRGVFDRTIPLNLRSGEAIPPVQGLHASTDWRVEYYAEDTWPRFQHAKAIKAATTTKTLEFDDVGRDTFAGAVTGNMDIPADGYYVLAVTTPDKARVAVAGKALVEQDGAKGTPYQAFVVPLRRGIYPLRLEFLHLSKASRMDFVVFQAKENEPEWWKNKILNLTSHSER